MASLAGWVETVVRLAAAAGGAERTQRAVDSLQTTVLDYSVGAVRAFVAFLQAVFSICVLLLSASFLYALLYVLVMPSKLHDRPVFLDFATDSGRPSAVVDFLSQTTQWSLTDACDPEGGAAAAHAEEPRSSWLWGESARKLPRVLKAKQKYAVSVDLELPESPSNEANGMFMVEVSLMDSRGTEIAVSRRPASVRFRSPLLTAVRVAVLAPLLLLDVARESQTVTLEMFDHYEEQTDLPFTRARVTISSSTVRVYKASVGIAAQLQGVRYYMQHWFYVTAALFILCIAALEAAVLSAIFLLAPDDEGRAGPETEDLPPARVTKATPAHAPLLRTADAPSDPITPDRPAFAAPSAVKREAAASRARRDAAAATEKAEEEPLDTLDLTAAPGTGAPLPVERVTQVLRNEDAEIAHRPAAGGGGLLHSRRGPGSTADS